MKVEATAARTRHTITGHRRHRKSSSRTGGPASRIVFSPTRARHLNSDAWEDQMVFLADRGVPLHCARSTRSTGDSSQPWTGNDCGHLAPISRHSSEELDLHDAVHVGPLDRRRRVGAVSSLATARHAWRRLFWSARITDERPLEVGLLIETRPRKLPSRGLPIGGLQLGDLSPCGSCWPTLFLLWSSTSSASIGHFTQSVAARIVRAITCLARQKNNRFRAQES